MKDFLKKFMGAVGSVPSAITSQFKSNALMSAFGRAREIDTQEKANSVLNEFRSPVDMFRSVLGSRVIDVGPRIPRESDAYNREGVSPVESTATLKRINIDPNVTDKEQRRSNKRQGRLDTAIFEVEGNIDADGNQVRQQAHTPSEKQVENFIEAYSRQPEIPLGALEAVMDREGAMTADPESKDTFAGGKSWVFGLGEKALKDVEKKWLRPVDTEDMRELTNAMADYLVIASRQVGVPVSDIVELYMKGYWRPKEDTEEATEEARVGKDVFTEMYKRHSEAYADTRESRALLKSTAEGRYKYEYAPIDTPFNTLRNLGREPNVKERLIPDTKRDENISDLLKRSKILEDKAAEFGSSYIRVDKLNKRIKLFQHEEGSWSDLGWMTMDPQNPIVDTFTYEGRTVQNTELANFFAGYNAKRSNIPIRVLKVGAMEYTFRMNFLDFQHELTGEASIPPFTNSIVGEVKDWKLYEAGFELAKQENVTVDDVLREVSKASKLRNK